MGLTPGTRLGPYEIVSPIGAGGMGEVYRARDTKLDRDVAIKVLPQHLAADPEALARFEREAKAVAALSHPNILSIHDFGRDASGVSYAAMELLEGGTLRERLSSGALPPKKVVQIGVDIAQGLAAAHARAIVHRDLKPENVFVTSDGRVKILDFGLARPMVLSGDMTSSPTAHTDPGTILGTVGYMSPEQVKGHPADHRSDVFSLGCVLYELATGRRAFQRDTAAETMTAILREDPPDLARDGGSSPSAIDPVIRHCLEKQPDERFQSARDLAFALQALSGTTTLSGATGRAAAPSTTTAVTRRISLLPIAAALLLVAAAFFAGRKLAPGASTTSLPLTFQQLTDDAGVETDPAISPDGASVAFTRRAGGKADIYVQRIGGRNAILVAGDPVRLEAAPVFSPDGASIAFHEGGGKGGIFVAGATGESTRRVTDFGFHPAWSPDSQRIVFCTEEIASPAGRSSTSELWVVDAKSGSPPTKLTDGDAVEPAWSPSGARIAYWAVDGGQRDLYTMPAGGGPGTAVTHDAALDWGPRWSPDGRALYFSSNRGGSMNIWRIAVDASGGPAGEPEPVTAGVTSAEQVSVSADGSRVVFRSAAGATNPIAIPFDPVAERAGPPTQLLDRTGVLIPTSISPKGDWLVLVNVPELQEDLFIMRPDGTDLRRLNDDRFRDRGAAWSPDGKEIAFYSNRTENYGIWAVRPDGSGLRRLTEETGEARALLYPIYSPTGDRLLASRVRTDEATIIDPRKEWKAQKPEHLSMKLPDGSRLVSSAWSPDGRLLGGTIAGASSPGVGVYDLAARTPRRVADLGCAFQGFAWLQDSKRLVCADQPAETLWLVDVESGRRKSLATGLKLGQGLVASPDGRTLYAAVNRQQADIWMVETKAVKR